MKKIIFSLIFLSASLGMWAQEISIATGSYTGCAGFLVDTGLSASNYGNNENHTFTVCPEAPETVINLYFNLFNLGDGDTMWIYDGPDASAPLLGEFQGFEAQAQDFFTGIDNVSHCLTVVFQSDGSDVGNFVAEISCGYPCERPFAIVETSVNADTLLVCIGEEITFDGNPSTVADGFEIIDWVWNFDDGVIDENSGPVVIHSFAESGDYKVQLFITDNNECGNNNLTDVLILVSTEPTFENTTQNIITCQGVEVEIHGEVTPVTWTGMPDINFGGALFIPDDQSECFESEITFNSFSPGQTLTDISDIESFFINFEHSYMGDLTVSFICPNGQSIAVHQQGGGGTFLGEPIDDDFNLNPGVGYDYWWAPDANNGTWAEEAGFGTLPSDIYSSVQPFELLLGCPLNGTWTVEICDSWGSDNGFIFDWTVNFNPELFPEIVTFTPEYEFDCNLNSWIGDDIISTSADCNEIIVTSSESGTYIYSYTVTDNFGCSYTHEVSVDVEDLPSVNANGNYDPCSQIATLTSSITNTNQLFLPYVFSWDPADMVINPNSANTSTDPVSETTTFSVTVFPSSIPGCSTTVDVEIVVNPEDILQVELDGPNSPCPGNDIALSAVAIGGFPEYSYSWDNGMSGSDITVSPMVTTTYTVTVVDECGETTGSITVEVSDPGTEIEAVDLILCSGVNTYLTNNITGGSGNYSFDFPEGFSMTNGNIGDNLPGIYVIGIVDDCVASGEITVTVANCEVIVPNIISPNNDNVNEAFVIEGLEYLPGSSLRIWNRWGNLVYETGDYQNNWKANDVSEGVYYYELILPTSVIHHGDVTVVRK